MVWHHAAPGKAPREADLVTTSRFTFEFVGNGVRDQCAERNCD